MPENISFKMNNRVIKENNMRSFPVFWTSIILGLSFSALGLGASGFFSQVLEQCLGAPEESHEYYEITDCGNEKKSCIRFSGHMDKFSASALTKIITEQRAKEVQFSSGGGDVKQIAVLRDFFNKNNITAVVKNGHFCISSCALLFSQLAHIAPEEGAEFGFHAEREDTPNMYYILNTSWRKNTWSERTICSMEKDLGDFGKGRAGRTALLRELQHNNILYHLDVKYIKWKDLVLIMDGSLQTDSRPLFQDLFDVKSHLFDGPQQPKRLSNDPEAR